MQFSTKRPFIKDGRLINVGHLLNFVEITWALYSKEALDKCWALNRIFTVFV